MQDDGRQQFEPWQLMSSVSIFGQCVTLDLHWYNPEKQHIVATVDALYLCLCLGRRQCWIQYLLNQQVSTDQREILSSVSNIIFILTTFLGIYM